jgi:hypothetical protein
MAAVIGALKDMRGEMDEMARLELEIMSTYAAAMKRVGSALTRQTLLGFRDAHMQHWKNLTGEVRRISDLPALQTAVRVPPHPSGPVSAYASEEAVLAALHQSELTLCSLYERWARSAAVQPLLRYLFRSCLADGRRHRSWLQRRLVDRRREVGPRMCG